MATAAGTQLWNAVEDRNLAECQRLLAAGVPADSHGLGCYGDTSLGVAARNGDLDIATALVVHGASVDKPDQYGDRPLFLAATCGHTAVVALLLDGGARVDVSASYGAESLFGAASGGHAAVVKLLLEHGASGVKCDESIFGRNSWTALSFAAHHGHLAGRAACVRVLLAALLPGGAAVEVQRLFV